MSGSPVDFRIRRTRQRLRDALITLMQARDFEALHVQDIADTAGINRATFYLHYQDKYDLLLRCAEDEIERLTAQFTGDPAASLTALFMHVADHAAFYRVMLGVGLFSTRLQAALETLPVDTSSPAPHDLFAGCRAGAILGALRWWLRQDSPPPPGEMAAYLLQFVGTDPANPAAADAQGDCIKFPGGS